MKKIVSLALVLMLVFALTISVAAKVDSPSGKDHYAITTAYDPGDGSLGTASSDKNQVDVTASGDDALVHLTASQTKGVFSKWTISGDYEIVEGDLNSPKLTIIPKSDIHAVAVFKGSGVSTPDDSGNKSDTSPKTGDPLLFVLALGILALGAGAVAVKKIKE